MSDCCRPNTSAKIEQLCPECGSAGKSVAMLTLYHQVRFPENQTLNAGSYHFCPLKTCPVAYFSSGGETVSKQHLRSYPDIQDDMICYCFDINAEDYLSALKANRAEAVKSFVVQRTKARECACEIRNPSGQCCLANFKHFEKD